MKTKGMVFRYTWAYSEKIQWHIHAGSWSLVNCWWEALTRHYIRCSWILMNAAVGLMDGLGLDGDRCIRVIPRQRELRLRLHCAPPPQPPRGGGGRGSRKRKGGSVEADGCPFAGWWCNTIPSPCPWWSQWKMEESFFQCSWTFVSHYHERIWPITFFFPATVVFSSNLK